MTFEEYIQTHGLNQETITNFNLSFDPKRNAIVIPIINGQNRLLYNKYRNLGHEDNPEIPKYQFDSGSKATIFNVKALEGKFVIITEGEIDAIRLIQEELPAISSTAGAQNLPEDIIPILQKKTLFLCYDNDQAGIDAVKKFGKLLPKAYVVILPEGSKDVCEYLQTHTKSDFLGLLSNAKNKDLTAFHFSAPHKVLRAKELAEYQFPQIRWLIKDLLPAEGFTALTAAPYSYKSFLTEYFALCIAQGNSVFNQYETSKSPVLIIDKENPKVLLQDRFKKLGLNDNPEIYILDDPDSFSIQKDESLSWLIQFILEKNIKLLIIDSFVHIHKGDENDSMTIAATFEQLKKIPCAILFIHHHRKTIKFFTGTLLESIRGSSDIAAELTSHIAIDVMQTGLRITQGKNRWGALIKPFLVIPLIHEETITFEFGGEIQEEILKSEKAKTLIGSLFLSQKSWLKKDIVANFEGQISQRTIADVIKNLVKERLIIESWEGQKRKYEATEDFCNELLQSANVPLSASEQYYQEKADGLLQ